MQNSIKIIDESSKGNFDNVIYRMYKNARSVLKIENKKIKS